VDPSDDAPPTDRIIAQFIAEAFSSPYPPPEVMRLYEEAVPGLANRMVDATEQIGLHKREIELIRVNAQVESMRRDYAEGRRGQICAVLVAFAAIAGSTYTATHGSQLAASVLGVGGLGTIVTAFVYGRKKPGKTEDTPAKEKKNG
jgi:uncharacterized membrane protein